MKKTLLKIYLLFILLIIYGALVILGINERNKFPFFEKSALFIAQIPFNIYEVSRYFFVHDGKPENLVVNTKDINKHLSLAELENTKNFEFKGQNALMLVGRYDPSIPAGIIDIIDLNTNYLIHRIIPNLKDYEKYKMSNLFASLPDKEYFIPTSPILTNDGNLIFNMNSPLYKVDLCGNTLWINDKFIFHHMMNELSNNSFISPIKSDIPSDLLNLINNDKFVNEGYAIISQNGDIVKHEDLYSILKENNLINKIISKNGIINQDIFHLNDIEEVKFNGKYFKKNDLFFSVRNMSSIIHYRPKTKKIIKIIEGPFINQHDIDIVGDGKITIFNNNALNTMELNNLININNSEIIEYDYETKNFKKKYNDLMKSYKIKSTTEGSFHEFNNKNFLIDDSTNSVFYFFDKNKKLFNIYENIYKNKKYALFWPTIVEDKDKIKKLKNNIRNLSCDP